MRIADHAPAMQSSQALQQPAATTHQQQVMSGQVAAAAVARENEKRNTEVNTTEKTENLTIRGEEQGRNRKGREDSGESSTTDESGNTSTSRRKPPSEPGNGNLLDVIA